MSAYPAIVPVASLIKLSPEYHRAIAKIAFHFFIWCSFPQITGFEPEFNGIKQFIWQGGDSSNHVRSNAGPFERDQIGEGPYAHVLAAGVADNEAVATVQLFAGSDSGINLIAKATDGRSFPVQLKNMSLLRIVIVRCINNAIVSAETGEALIAGCNREVSRATCGFFRWNG